ncbi:MAG: class I SAM-dependent methyltransferase [Pseudomonadales bacterium]
MRLLWTADEALPPVFEALFEVMAPGTVPDQDELHLRYGDGVLRLCRGADLRGVHVRREDIQKRLKGDFMLGRACAGSTRHGLRILDAMAGLGTDGLALALRGHRVTLVERNPVLWALLSDLLQRMDVPDLVLQLGDCRTLLESPDALSTPYDVIYLDPMFPQRSKRALPGKPMQYVTQLLGEDAENGDQPDLEALRALIQSARNVAGSHVVLKRRRTDPVVGTPDWQLKGRSVRYDMFRRL